MRAWRLARFDRIGSFVPLPIRHLSSQPLQSFSNVWQVSSYGRCCSSKGIISEGYLHPNGYRYVGIACSSWPVHRIVMLAFQGLPPNAQTSQVHHKDGNRANNRLDNLEYVTQSQNTLFSYALGTRKNSGEALSKPVVWRRLGSEAWSASRSVTQAAQWLGVAISTVSRACRKHVPVKGYELQFEEVSDLVLPGEEWRPMLGPTTATPVAGRTVSSLGRVTSKRGVVSWGCLEPDGYYVTTILTTGGRVRAPVHRLVAMAFLEPPSSDSMVSVNHKDLDKGNNCKDNLEWLSHADNVLHFHANAAVVRKTGVKAIFSRPYGSNDKWKWHPSMQSAAKELGMYTASISKCARGEITCTGGYEFKLAPSAKSLPGEEWRVVDLDALKRDRKARTQ